jgi:hypothetical protein
MKTKKLLAFILFVSTCAGIINASVQHNNTNDYNLINNKILKLGHQYGLNNVLVAYDLDTTLLTPNHYLGSEPWFNWQVGLLNKNSQYSAGNNFATILKKQNIIMKVVKMHPTQKCIPANLANYQKLGYKLLVLTARGPNVRDITEQNLKNNKILKYFKENSIAIGSTGKYLPYDISSPDKYGLSKDELEYYKISKNPRMVSFSNGIFMACGNNKGLMLQTLLKKAKNKNIKCVIFIDNTQKNNNNVYDAFNKFDNNIHVETFTYGYSNKWYNNLLISKNIQKQCNEEWKTLEAAINNITV